MNKLYFLFLLTWATPCGAQTISTLAGTVTSGYMGDSGPATNAELFHPKGTAIDDSGNVFIADADNNVVRKVTPGGIITTVAGLPAGGFSGDGALAIYALLSRPNSLAIDHAHNIYICDADNQRIRKIDAAGIIHTICGDGTAAYSGDGGPATAAELNFPGGIALDKHGNLFVTDEYNNMVRKIDAAGIITKFAGSGTTGYPGDLENADTAAIGFPFGIAVDTNDNVYFSLTLDNRICKVNPAHMLSSIAGVGGGTGGYGGDGGLATAAQFDNPWGICTDKAGNVYVADNANERIRKITPGGTISTVAGNGSSGFSGDGGPAVLAKLKDPAGVNTDGLGNLYIADYNNHRVRKVNTSIALNVSEPSGKQNILVYPNPCHGELSIHITSGTDETERVRILDMVGRLLKEMPVKTNEPTVIQLGLPAGNYLLQGKEWQEKIAID